MEKLIFFLFHATFFLSNPIFAQKVEKLKLQKFESQKRFNNHLYGGISGLTYADGFLWSISDDRGQYGPPRLYKNSIIDNVVKIENEILLLAPTDSLVVDYEALYRFKNGDFLISSEGDLNKKPRVAPYLKFWSEAKKWGIEIELPPDLYSEKIGMQTKGLQNNSAFEAVTVSQDEKTIYLISEAPLYQNKKSEIEFLTYERSEKYNHHWKLKSRQIYTRGAASKSIIEVMRGVSEILYWNKDHLLVLERWVRLNQSKVIKIGAELFSVNLKNLKKKKIFTFDADLAANWEGLAWGPNLSDGRKLLILVSDNNFEKQTPTQYLFLAFQEESP